MTKKFIDGMETHIELSGFTAKYYDTLMNLVSFGVYPKFINGAMKSIGVSENDTVLDLGCGTGRNLEILRKLANGKGSFYGIDLGEEMVAQAKARFAKMDNTTIVQGSILEDLPFGHDFDHITTSFVLHGFSHEQRLTIAGNAHAHLKQGGIFSFLDWTPGNLDDAPKWFQIFFKKIECPIAYEFIKHDYSQEFNELGYELLDKKPRIKGRAQIVRLKKQ